MRNFRKHVCNQLIHIAHMIVYHYHCRLFTSKHFITVTVRYAHALRLCVTVRYGALRWCVTVRYDGALRCVTAVRYGSLWCVTVRYGALRYVTVRYAEALRRCVTVRYGALWCVTEVGSAALRCVTLMRYGSALRCVTGICYSMLR